MKTRHGLRFYLNTKTMEANWQHPLEVSDMSLLDCTDMNDADFEALFVSWLQAPADRRPAAPCTRTLPDVGHTNRQENHHEIAKPSTSPAATQPAGSRAICGSGFRHA